MSMSGHIIEKSEIKSGVDNPLPKIRPLCSIIDYSFTNHLDPKVACVCLRFDFENYDVEAFQRQIMMAGGKWNERLKLHGKDSEDKSIEPGLLLRCTKFGVFVKILRRYDSLFEFDNQSRSPSFEEFQ